MKKAGKSRKTQLVFMKGNMCTWRGEAVADVLSCITLLLLTSWAVSRFCCKCLELYHVSVANVLSCIHFCCWCLELYHVSVADVLSCITFSVLMFWAVSRFCCWCLELYHVFGADVLSCITLLWLLSWAVARFCCWCFELCHFAIVAASILCRFFPNFKLK